MHWLPSQGRIRGLAWTVMLDHANIIHDQRLHDRLLAAFLGCLCSFAIHRSLSGPAVSILLSSGFRL
jgi:hypothetical protein